jgi:hypothetical protein
MDAAAHAAQEAMASREAIARDAMAGDAAGGIS